MYSNVLYALDPTGTHIQDLYTYVKGAIIRRTVAEPGVVAMGDDWLFDTVGAFVDDLFSKKTDMDPEVREGLIKDMEDLTNRTRDELKAQARSHTAQILTEQVHFAAEASQTIHSASILYTGLRHWSYDAMATKALKGHQPADLSKKGGKFRAVMMVSHPYKHSKRCGLES